jgi:acetyl-CoA C-acetyltransferase
MSRAPYYAMDLRWGRKLGETTMADAILADGLTDPGLRIVMGDIAERIADAFQISRVAQDEFAWRSQQRAGINRERFRREIISIQTAEGLVENDEHPRPDTNPEKLAQLQPAFRANGTVTAGNASGLNDGAALMLVANETVVQRHQLQPRARIVAASAVGCDPGMMGLGPVAAIGRVCKNAGWNLGAVDAVEINEAFAVQALACAQELKLDMEKLNQRGGAIALGHPVGCSGARVLVTLLHLMEDLKLKRGIASLCVGGGMGIALAVTTEL